MRLSKAPKEALNENHVRAAGRCSEFGLGGDLATGLARDDLVCGHVTAGRCGQPDSGRCDDRGEGPHRRTPARVGATRPNRTGSRVLRTEPRRRARLRCWLLEAARQREDRIRVRKGPRGHQRRDVPWPSGSGGSGSPGRGRGRQAGNRCTADPGHLAYTATELRSSRPSSGPWLTWRLRSRPSRPWASPYDRRRQTSTVPEATPSTPSTRH